MNGDRPRELPAPERQRDKGREQWLTAGVALLAVLLLLALGALFLPRSRERVVVTQPAAAAAPPMQHQDPALLNQLVAARTCVVLAKELVRPAENLRTSWLQHATAHRLGRSGEISETEMRRRWKVTLAQRTTQDPAFMRALDAMRTACDR